MAAARRGKKWYAEGYLMFRSTGYVSASWVKRWCCTFVEVILRPLAVVRVRLPRILHPDFSARR